MTRREARKLVRRAAAAILDNDGENVWLSQNEKGEDLTPADKARVRAAFEELVEELRGEP